MDEKQLIHLIKEGYQRRIRHFDMEKKTFDIVIAGDSMAAYLSLHHYFPHVSIMNQGIPGDTTKGLMQRIHLIAKVSPKIVFLNIGSNDLVLLHKKPMEIVESIVNIIHLIKQVLNQVHIYLFNITPVNETVKHANHLYIYGRKNEDIIEINRLLSIHIPTHMLIDIHQHVIDEKNQLDASLTHDGIHLNDLGYDIYTKLMNAYI